MLASEAISQFWVAQLVCIQKHLHCVANTHLVHYFAISTSNPHGESAWNVFWQFEGERDHVLALTQWLGRGVGFATALHENAFLLDGAVESLVKSVLLCFKYLSRL